MQGSQIFIHYHHQYSFILENETRLSKNNRNLATKDKIVFNFTLSSSSNLKDFLFAVYVSQCQYNHYTDTDNLNSYIKLLALVK